MLHYLPPLILLVAVGVGLTFKLESLASIDLVSWAGASGRHTIRKSMAAAVLAAGLYVILSSDFTARDAYWAFAAIGIIVGLWLSRRTHIVTQ